MRVGDRGILVFSNSFSHNIWQPSDSYCSYHWFILFIDFPLHIYWDSQGLLAGAGAEHNIQYREKKQMSKCEKIIAWRYRGRTFETIAYIFNKKENQNSLFFTQKNNYIAQWICPSKVEEKAYCMMHSLPMGVLWKFEVGNNCFVKEKIGVINIDFKYF